MTEGRVVSDSLSATEPIDYLVIGHITQDLQPDGTSLLGGTAWFAGNVARDLGLRVGIVTTVGPQADLSQLSGESMVCYRSPFSTTIENSYGLDGRIQYLHHRANDLDFQSIPRAWRRTPIVHLGPLVHEVDPNIISYFPDSFIGITPQGWLRRWDERGRVYSAEWADALNVLPKAHAAVLSIEDVDGDWECLDIWAEHTRVLVVTQAAAGATIITNGERRQFPAPRVVEVNPTGAGDVLAAAFFIRYQQTGDCWQAGRYAVRLASDSVTQVGLPSKISSDHGCSE